MATTIYVGNLPYQATPEELEELFGQFGQVEKVDIISDRFTGKSRGFGFVEMTTGEEAQAAIAALQGKQFGNRDLVVNEARPRTQRED
jgi:RNA recognition motif-containing protein